MKRLSAVIFAAFFVLYAATAQATVASSTSRMQYTCSGGSTYAFTFGVGATSEIQVIKTVTASQTETTLTETTDYTISATNNDYSSGGTVTTTTACATGNTLTILRNVPLTQASDFTEGMPTLYESFEDGLDKLTRITQQQQEEIDRSLRIPVSSSTSPTLPNPVANNYIGWNASGTGLANLTGPVVTTATQYEVDALITYGGGTSYTQATIATALTAIGTTNKVTLLLRPGNWVLLTAVAIPANVTLKMPAGAYFSGAGSTLITFATPPEGGIRPEMWGAIADNLDASATLNTTALNAASVVSGTTGTVIISDGTYKITAASPNYAVTFYGSVKGNSPNTSIIKNIGTGSAVKLIGTNDAAGDFYYVRLDNFCWLVASFEPWKKEK